MAGLFDQYEQASSSAVSNSFASTQPIASGYIRASLEDEVPIFSKKRITFDPKDNILHMCAADNYLLIGLSSNVLLRIDVEYPDRKDEVELPRSTEDGIFNLFLDPSGRHIIICMKSGENYYLTKTSKKPKPLSRLKGHLITAIGWNKYNVTDTGTGEILLGTKKGVIIETEISSTEDSRFFQSNLEKSYKQHITLDADKKVHPITGLAVEKIPSATENKYFIMATLPGRLYQFMGSIPASAEAPIFTEIFASHENSTVPRGFLEIPGNFGKSQLEFYYPKEKGLPQRFAWMTGPGVLTGDIDVSNAAAQDSVIVDQRLVQYLHEEGEPLSNPVNIVLTQFHILVAFPHRVKAICILNEQLVYNDVYSEKFGNVLGIIRDPMRGHVWTYTCKAVFRHTIYRESRDVWQIYLCMKQFEKALQFCKDNPVHMDQVLTAQAKHLFEQKQYLQSAHVYAQTQVSFEEVTLKFIRLQQKEALKEFLMRKLQSLRPQDKTQVTLLVAWLVELQLTQLEELRESERAGSPDYARLQSAFRAFLTSSTTVQECVSAHRGMIYELLASHGAVSDLVHFAELMRDYERVINHYLQSEQHVQAVHVLQKQPDVELFYKFSPILMQNVPEATVAAWKERRKQLDAKRLIPALVQYDHAKATAQDNAAIDYLEYCVQKLEVKDEAIHNYLLSLYARHQPDKLMHYLNFQGHDLESVCYDAEYALRLCSEHKRNEACVHIYSLMGLYEEAVDLAIQVDIALAKENAEKPDGDDELRKKLWLKIAKHVVQKKDDIRQAMELLHECHLLQIEDVLPFFKEFVSIDHFKDAICQSLAEYNQHIDALKEEMNEATESASNIRADIQSFRNKFACVKAQDKCASCIYPLMTRAFYVFPCQHRFHTDCLITEVLPHLPKSTQQKVDELQRLLASRDMSPQRVVGAGASVGDSPALTRRFSQRNVKEELDDIVAAECFYCGDLMIRLVDKGFLEDNDPENSVEGWL